MGQAKGSIVGTGGLIRQEDRITAGVPNNANVRERGSMKTKRKKK